MPFRLGPLELSLLLAIVILVFGVGRLGRLGAEVGRGIRAFREHLNNDHSPKA